MVISDLLVKQLAEKAHQTELTTFRKPSEYLPHPLAHLILRGANITALSKSNVSIYGAACAGTFCHSLHKIGRLQMNDSVFDLSVVIQNLRKQLREAQIEGVKQTPRFFVDEAVVELKVGVTDTGDGGLSFKVFGIGIGANAAVSAESLQTITLKLRPTESDHGPWETSGIAPVPIADGNIADR